MNKQFSSLFCALMLSATAAFAQYGSTPPLHVEGKYFVDPHGNKVVLHGVMDTPSPYFNSYRWGNSCTSTNISPCIAYFNKLFTAITDTASGAWCDLFRLHLDPCWTNDPNKQATNGGGENDISRFNPTRLRTYLRSLYFKIAKNAINKGLYVIMRPPGVFPETVKVGDEYNDYLMTVWDIVSQNDSVRKYSGQIMLELGNEPVNLRAADGKDSPAALHDFFQPIVDKIRANGFTGIILLPGTGWQSNYRNYATNPVSDYNYGYAVHDYVGWYNTNDNSYNKSTALNSFKEAVPVVEEKPIVITEVDWSPEKAGSGHYNEHGDWVVGNYGTWATGTTSKWGSAFKAVLDHFGNISMTLTGTGDFIDIDTYINNRKVVPAFEAAMKANGYPDASEACSGACFKWYKEYAQVKKAHPDFQRKYTADNGFGGFTNPLINADFPDPDVILVNDTYYMASTTMHHFPGATILKSKDLVNWEYCANPLQQIADNDAYNLLNNANRYAGGQWAPSLQYHNGKFYLNFIAFGRDGFDDGGDWLLSATDPEGEWTMTRLDGFYYDAGFLFDDNRDQLHGLGSDGEKNGDGFLYVAAGIDHITVHKLNASTFKEISSKEVITVGNGCEGSHMYHIGDYYYIYATYGGTEGSQTIFRAKDPMGPYEEHNGRVFANQKIHQGGIVQTQTGEWWTILFKDAGTIGRIPFLEPVKWVDGWPVIGNNGIDVTSAGKAYAKPNVGKTYPKTYLPTNDTFTDPKLGLQWQWNHNPDDAAWSLFESPGNLRLHTVSITDNLKQARNMLTQRIFGYNIANTAGDKYADSYGTVSIDTKGMQDGDIAGLCVFQDPYGYIAVKQTDGKRYIVQYRSAYDSNQPQETVSSTPIDFTDGEKVFLRAIVNFGTNKANFYYSTDNQSWTKFGNEMTMRYILSVFVGNRFGIFNYSTKQLGGYVDIDWFSTEKEFTEDRFYGEGILKTFTEEDLTIESLTAQKEYTLMPGASRSIDMTATFKSGITSNVASQCIYNVENPKIATVIGGKLIGQGEGSTKATATYTDILGNEQTVEFNVTVAMFPLTEDAVNPSIYGSGTFKQTTGALTTSQYGFGGWEYGAGVDLSAYDKIVIKLRRAATNNASFRLFDENNYWSSPFIYELGNKKTIEISLKDLKKEDGTPFNLSHVYIAGFWTTGGSAIYISDVHLERSLIGDVNEDGQVDISDIVAVINQIAGTAQYPKADVNADDKVDISDIVAIINIIAAQ